VLGCDVCLGIAYRKPKFTIQPCRHRLIPSLLPKLEFIFNFFVLVLQHRTKEYLLLQTSTHNDTTIPR
jgi:hypothetical protein